MPKPSNTEASTAKAGAVKTLPMIQKPKHTLVNNTLLLIIIPVIVLWVFYLTIIYQGVYKTTEEKHIDQTSLLNFECASHINNQLSAISNQVYTVTHSIKLTDTILLSEINNRLTRILTSNKHIYGTSISLSEVWLNNNKKHDYFLYKYKSGDSVKSIVIDQNNYSTYPYKEKEWWKYSATHLESRWSNPYYDKGLGNVLMITYSAPVFINKRFAGIISIDVDVATLNSIINNASHDAFDVFDKTQVIVFSADSTIVVAKQMKHIGEKLNKYYGKNKYFSFVKALNTIFKNRFGYTDFEFDNTRYKMFYGPIPQANWIIVSILESSEINNAVWVSILPKIIMTIIFIVILIILLYLLSKKIARPITELCDVTLKIANGDYTETIVVNRDDELGMLAHNFQIMKENLKKREQNLKEASTNMKQLLDNLPLAVLQFNKERKITYFNKIGKNRLYINFDEKTIKDFPNWLFFIKDEEDRKKAERAFLGEACVLEGFNVITDSPYGKTYFTNKYVQAHFIPHLKNNAVDSVTLILLDLTEVKQNENLRVEKKSAEIANKAKSEFLARMSHEIRTPLNAVIGFANLALQKQVNADKLFNYLSKIKSSANHLLTIINDILDYSKIEAGKIELEYTAFDIEELLTDVFDLSASVAHNKNLELIVSHSPLIPCPITGDVIKLKQIIVNLVSNAIKFTQEGEIHVNVDVKKQTKNKITLLFSVKDTGIGLSDEQQKILFQPFVQADGSITRRFGGTGIGLTISKRLAELMNGKIWVESNEGEGSTFWFTAEFKTESKKESFSKYIQKFELPNNFSNLNVLVCDDNKTSLNTIKTMLNDFNFNTTTVSTGSSVIKLLQQGKSFDLLIIDYLMPGTNGIKTMEAIVNRKLKNNLNKVILLSNHNEPVVETELPKYGIDLLRHKPLTYSGLFDSIMSVFGKKNTLTDKRKQQQKEKHTIEMLSEDCTILVADDNEVNREVIGDLLETMGMKTDFATTGKEVLDMVKTAHTKSDYCMILMDIQMPVMDGYEATRNLRRIHDFKNLPVIALSADVMQGVKEQCMAAGMNDYISKPINPSELARVITKWAKNIIVKHDTASSSQVSELQHINTQEGIKRIGGDADKFIKLLKKFRTRQHDFVKNLNKLQNKEEKLKFIHTFKGVTGNISAINLHGLVIDLEKNVKQDKDYSNILLQIDAELKAVVAEIDKTELKDEKVQAEKQNKKTKAQLTEALKKAETLLEDGNPDALEALEMLKPFFKNNATFKKSIQSAAAYRFDEASALIKTIKI